MLLQKCSSPVLRASRTKLIHPTTRLFAANGSSRRPYASATQLPEIYDVVILGGGPAGLALAAALRSSQTTSALKVGLIDAQTLSKSAGVQQDAPLDHFSNRCSSLAPTSLSFLEEIGAKSHLNTSRVQSYNHMKVWDAVTNSRLTFDWATAYGLPSLSSPSDPPQPSSASHTIAYMTENTNITTALLTRLDELGGCTLLPSIRVESIDFGKDTEELDMRSWPVLQLMSRDSFSSRTLAARLLVGADGPNSVVRTFAGIKNRGWEYERSAVVATLRLDSHIGSSPETAYQRFLPSSGPIALLPLPNDHASLVWSTTSQRASLFKSLTPTDFTAAINAAFRLSPADLDYILSIPSGQADELSWRLQYTSVDSSLAPPIVADVQEGSLASFPLRMKHADTYTGERVALVGDAAHVVHPLGGQGLNLGLADAKALADVLAEGVARGADVGDVMLLEELGRRRWAKNHAVQGACDKLHKVFDWESGPVAGVRGLGMDLVERWGGLKGFVMGLAGGR